MRPLTFGRGICVSSDKAWDSCPAAALLETSSVARNSVARRDFVRNSVGTWYFIGSPSRFSSSYPFLSRSNSRWRSLRCDFQVVEMRDRVRLCPEPDLTRILERAVSGLDYFVAVVVTSDLVAHGFHSELMPFSRRNFEIGTSELAAPAVYHVIEPVVVLQGVGAHDV